MANHPLPLPSTEPAPQEESDCLLVREALPGRLRLRGQDRADFLHRLSTNDILGLAPGQGNFSALLNTRGRLVELLQVLVDEAEILLLTSSGNAENIRAWLDRYLFREAVDLEEARSLACLGLYGPQAPFALSEAAGGAWDQLPLGHHRSAEIAGASLKVARSWPLAGAGFLLLGSEDEVDAVAGAMVARGARRVGAEMLERYRVEAAVPTLGRELSEDFNPWEASLDGAISVTKGCYLGQEVVARLHTYRKVQRRLVGIELQGSEPPDSPAPIFSGSEEIGVLTSSAPAPRPGKPLGLGVLKIAHCQAGEEVQIGRDEALIPGRVRDTIPPLAATLAGSF